MNILIFTQYFWPENFRINEIAYFFKKKLGNTDVLTSYPSYPSVKNFKNFLKNKDKLLKKSGLKIFRFKTYPRNINNLSIFLNTLTFILFSPFFYMHNILKKNYDLIFLFCPSPILSVIPIILLNKIFKKKVVIWVLDLWPDTLVDLNIINNSKLIKILQSLVNFIYNNSDLILCQSKSFQKNIKIKNKKKLIYFPAWPEEEVFKKNIKKKILSLNKFSSFKILFAGNVGEAQSFTSVLKCTEIIKKNNIDIKWVILGDGRFKEKLIKMINKKNLNNYFIFPGSVPPNKVILYINSVDALFLSLKKNNTFKKTIPGKLQTYLLSNKPILGMISGEAKKIIEDSKSGLVCEAEDFKKLFVNIIKFINTDKRKMKEYAKNGIIYANKHFNKKIILNNLLKKIHKI